MQLFQVSQILASVEDILDYDELTNNKSISFNSNTQVTTVLYRDTKLTVDQFLETINLSKYVLNFMSNGFDDACFLVGTKIFGVAIFFNKHNL